MINSVSIYSVLNTILGIQKEMVTKMGKIPVLMEINILVGEIGNKQIN